jgi:hypothetical protein
MFFFDNDYDSKRTLGIRDKQILYRNAKKRCENPACGKKIEFDEMQVGHKTAWSRGGRTTLKNSVCLCYRCNKLQGTDSWATFLKKQGVEDPKTKMKKALQALSIKQLKYLADKHNIKVKGQVVEDFFDSYRKAPTKGQYINKLAGVVTEKEISSVPKETPRKIRRKKKKSSDDFWL